MKIKHTIYIILSIFTVLPLLGFGIFMVYESNHNIENIMEENLRVASGAQILDIENFCRNKSESLDNFCQLDLVHNAINASLGKGEALSAKERAYLQNTMQTRSSANEFTDSISILNKNFTVVASSKPYQYGTISELSHAKERFVTGEFQFSNILSPESTGNEEEIVTAIKGIYEQDALTGYVVEEVNLHFFEKIRTETNLWENGTLYLLDGSGQMITAGNGAEDSRQSFVTSGEERQKFMDLWSKIDFKAEPAGELKYTVDSTTYMTYYSEIDFTDWTILLSIDLSHFQEKKSAYTFMIIIVVLAVSAMFIVLNHLISSRLTTPVQSIIDTLRNIRSGQDYTLRVQNLNQNEIGSLAGEINVLLDYVEQEKLLEKERQEKLKRTAERDPLTGIYNRKAVDQRLQNMLERAGKRGQKAAVIILDVDDFKDYNTQYGHSGGDRVLKHIADALTGIDGGIPGRIGGDEFILGMEDAADSQALMERMERLLSDLNRNFMDEETGKQIPIRLSIGIAVVDGRRMSYGTAFQKADEALYQVKEDGKNTCHMVFP